MAVTRQILGKVVITNRGEYNSSTVYEILDVVSYQGSSYLSKVYDNNSLPTDDTKWQLLAKKGDTYEVSETDIENIANQITENANSNFNRNVSEKTETFNSNAKTKTDEFNSNANNTVSAYNVNAENKLKEYNENDTVKLKKYNDNATSSVDNYNSNAGTKLNEYNTNSVNKLKEYNDNATKAFNNYNSNATTKLDEYNTNSDTKLKEYNDNASQKINEYDAHSKELNEKADSTRKELDRVKNEILDQGEAMGAFIHLEDSAMAEFQELSIDGVLKQETTKGLNFWFNATKNQGESNGITFTLNKDGTYMLNGKNDGSYNSICFLNSLSNQLFLKAGTYYTIKTPMSGISMTGLYVLDGVTKYIQLSSFTIDEFTLDQDVEMRTYLQVYQGTNTTFNNVVLRPMISKQKIIDSDYEPYTGGQPSPSLNYPQLINTLTGSQKVISCNKNLFNKSNFKVLEGYYIGTNGNVGQATTNSIIYMPIKSNTSYSIQKVSSNRFRVGTYSNLEVLGKILNNVIKNLDDSITSYVLNNDNDKYLFFQYLGGDTNEQEILDSIQIEEGPIPTQLVEHQESSLIFDIPNGEFVGRIDDTYKDELAVVYNEEDGQFHKILKKKIGRMTLNGSEKWSTNDAWNGKNTSNYILLEKKFLLNRLIVSDRFTYNATAHATDINGQIGLVLDGNLLFRVSNNIVTNIDEFKSWLSTHNANVYYVLTEPYEIDLGVCDMPFSYDKVTNIFTDNEFSPNISAKYYRNFTKTIQNLQINEKELKQELIEINSRLSTLEAANNTAVSNSIQIEEGEVSE